MIFLTSVVILLTLDLILHPLHSFALSGLIDYRPTTLNVSVSLKLDSLLNLFTVPLQITHFLAFPVTS